MPRTVLAAALAAALPALAPAQDALTIYSSARPGALSPQAFRDDGDGTNVPGYAVVRTDRDFALKPGRNVLRVDDVAALIDPTTVAFSVPGDPGARVVEQSFEFDLTSSAKLLARYLGREITVEQPRGQGVEQVTGELLGTRGALTLREAGGSVRILPGHAGVRLPGLPDGLITRPTLVWELDGARGGSERARFSYQTAGLTWWADYNLTYSEPRPGACRVDAGAWVTIVNRSGAAFRDARLKLVAGDVQHVQAPGRIMPEAAAMRPQARADGFQERAFFEYHLYTLGRPASLADNATKQIELFPVARNVGCEKTLVYAGQAGAFGNYGAPMIDRNFGLQAQPKVDVFLRLRNAQDNGLGLPLPAGRVRVSQRDEADGALELVGEDVIDHTARDETVQVRLGSAFDVVGERRQVDFRIDSAARWMEEDIEVKVRNHKRDQAVPVLVREGLYRWGQWRIVKASGDYVREDARTIRFPVRVAPGGEAVVRYTVRYRW